MVTSWLIPSGVLNKKMIKFKQLSKNNLPDLDPLTNCMRYPVNSFEIWVKNYVTYLSKRYHHYVLEVRELGELVGALTLSSIKKQWYKPKNKAFTQLGVGPSDFFDLYVLPGHMAFACQELSLWLSQNTEKWSIINLNLIPIESNFPTNFIEACQDKGLKIESSTEKVNYRINTDGSLERFEQALGSKGMKEINYYRRRAQKDGLSVVYREIKQNTLGLFDRYLPWYSTRRNSRSQSNVFELFPEVLPFLRNVIPAYEKKGQIRFSMLELDEKPVAVSLNLFYEGILYYYMPMFDEDYRKYAPGKLLLFELIKTAINSEDVREVNLMRGGSQYKEFFKPEKSLYVSLRITHNDSLSR